MQHGLTEFFSEWLNCLYWISFWQFRKWLCSCYLSPIRTLVIFLQAILSVPISLHSLHSGSNESNYGPFFHCLKGFCFSAAVYFKGFISFPLQSVEFYCCFSQARNRALVFLWCIYLIRRAGSCYLNWNSLSHPLVILC